MTKPFSFKGKRRRQQAEEGIKTSGKVDSFYCIERPPEVRHGPQTTFANALIADDVLRQAVVSISELIKNTGFINLDFADVTAIMKDAGFAHMGVGHAAGKNKAEDAAKQAVSSPLMETSIDGARGVLVNITGSLDIGLEDVEIAANLVSRRLIRMRISYSEPHLTKRWMTRYASPLLQRVLRISRTHSNRRRPRSPAPAGPYRSGEKKEAQEPKAGPSPFRRKTLRHHIQNFQLKIIRDMFDRTPGFR